MSKSHDPAASGRPFPWRRAEWLLPFGVAAWFLWTGLRATPFRHGPVACLVLALLYGSLALFLHLGARFALRAGAWYGALACLALALAPGVQLRLDAQELVRAPFFALFALLLGTGYFLALRPFVSRERRAAPRPLLGAYAALAALVAGTGLAARWSEELRWHLLNHHRLLGTPLYYLTARPLDSERDDLWTRRGRLGEPWEHAGRVPPVEEAALFGRPPHVVFLLLDTLRADALASLGGRPDVMPRLNALAERSLVFSDLRANASWTRASCASIFTGLLPEEHGASRFHERLAESWPTLAERLGEAGYQTAAFVSNWVQVGRETGFAQGFDVFRELSSAEEILERTGGGAAEVEVRGAYARAEVVNRETLSWLASDERDPHRPLFLYLHYLDPHSPYLEPPEPGTARDPAERKRGLYRQQLRYLDRQLDELVRRVQETLGGNTVFLFTSDHGEEFWEHDEWGHGHALYKELVWVPLVVHRPLGPAGSSDAPLESRDLCSLVLDLAREPELDLLRWGREHARHARYASQYLDRVDDVRPDKKWTGLRRLEAGGKTLIWSAFGPTLELYDMSADPGELDNRIEREPARALELRRALESAVDFWTAPSRVERSERDLAFLRALGYAGGVDQP